MPLEKLMKIMQDGTLMYEECMKIFDVAPYFCCYIVVYRCGCRKRTVQSVHTATKPF